MLCWRPLFYAVIGGHLFFLLAVPIPVVFLGDAWAWLAAPPGERAKHLAEIDRRVASGVTPPPDQLVIFGRPLPHPDR